MLLSSVYFVVVIILLGLCSSVQLSNYFLGGCQLYSGSPSPKIKVLNLLVYLFAL